MIRVLICDDQDLVCEGLKAILSTNPELEVVGVANNGAEAIEMIPSCQPDLILMDLKMPGMNGLELQEKLAKSGSTMSIIFMSAHEDALASEQAMKAGAVAFLQKPFEDQILIEKVNSVLNRIENEPETLRK